MYGLTRATVTLLAAAVAGFLIWIATQVGDSSNGEYWATYGLIAAAGLVMALSQLLGGWTKWGWPRISINVLLWAFVPAAIAVLWIVIFHQPHHGIGRNHIRKWSNEIGIDGFVKDFKDYVGVLAFGLGLLFGYAFDTTGPIRRGAAAPASKTVAGRAASVPAPSRPAPPRDTPAQEAPRREPVRTDSRSE
jgi:drug/metabolite transporter superfamily protein YnfA